jgi:predicted dehydrogenase
MKLDQMNLTNRVLRMGMVGGGPGSFIGPIHRMAAELDGCIRLVAGVFSRDLEKSRMTGEALGLDRARIYPDLAQMAAAEAQRPDGIDLVAVVTPNNLHFSVSRAALEAGLHVMCDKPATLTLAEARDLRGIIAASGRRYGLTYTYAGYPMVREAREIVRRGELGRVRKVVVEYSQGWLSEPVEQRGDRQAVWRSDPSQAGLGGCIADIGVHAFHLAEHVSGLRIERLCADLSSVVPGRVLDDDCNVLLRFAGGAPGVLVASQIAAGDRNGLRLKVYGEKGGLDWSHDAAQTLTLNWIDRPNEVRHAGAPYLTIASRTASRLPTGHPEGFIEALANLYRDFAASIRGQASASAGVPDIEDGIRGMAFIKTAVEASRAGAGWVRLQGFE